MEEVEAPPRVQILVCVNHRPPPAELPSCSDAGAAIYRHLHRLVLSSGRARDVYVTRTHCMAWCHEAGATVAVQPHGLWWRGVTPADVSRLWEERIEPLIVAATE